MVYGWKGKWGLGVAQTFHRGLDGYVRRRIRGVDGEVSLRRTGRRFARRLVTKALSTGDGIISYEVAQEFLDVATRKLARLLSAKHRPKDDGARSPGPRVHHGCPIRALGVGA